jgi:hypothetical protein
MRIPRTDVIECSQSESRSEWNGMWIEADTAAVAVSCLAGTKSHS